MKSMTVMGIASVIFAIHFQMQMNEENAKSEARIQELRAQFLGIKPGVVMLEFKEKEKRKALHVEVETKLLEEVKAEAKKHNLNLRQIVEAGFVAFLAQKSLEEK